MSEISDSGETRRPSSLGVPFLRGVLALAALAMAAGGVVIAGLLLSDKQPTPGMMAGAIAAILGGLVLAALLAAASMVLGMLSLVAGRLPRPEPDTVRPALERLEQSLRVLNNLQNRPDLRSTEGPVVAGPLNGTGRPLHLLEQIRDLTLMNEDQRKRYAVSHWAHRKQSHLEGIERDVLVGDWVSAFARLEELQIVLPGDTQVAELRERVESEQSSRLEEDIRAARGRLRTLVSSALWPQAEEMAAALQSKYPGKEEGDRLVEDVRRERDNWERENMERLFHDITAATERKQWRPAILALEEFVRRYPLDPRAEALRMDLPTLQENAASHERKEQEEHFKELLKKQHYEEALGVARAAIQKYPQSPTAVELNKLLPRVEELAKAESARAAAQQAAAPVPAGA